MKTSRIVFVAGGAAAILGAGYVAGPESFPVLDTAAPSPSPGEPTASAQPELINGTIASTQRGPVQVQIAVLNGQIVGVTTLSGSSPHPNTLRIVADALPVLRERVIQAQSWEVEYASGASFFSPGFSESVRGAMEAAGLTSGSTPVQQPGEGPDGRADYSRPGPEVEVVIPPWSIDAQANADAADEGGTAASFDGPSVSNARGSYQARIVVEDGVVTDVQALEAGTDAADSVRVNGFAVPELRARVLEAQDWDVEHVSGASFTSPAFIESLEGAFNDAGL
jgi:uncharacterized protein with FMN-binding domain